MDHNFIDYLQKELNTRIEHSSKIRGGKNTFQCNENREIIRLCLYEVPIKSLDILLSIASSLIELTLRDADIQDLTNIKYFTKLETLHLNCNPIDNSAIFHLSHLNYLKCLDISATDIESHQNFTQSIYQLTHLEELNLGWNDDINEVDLLALPRLKFLNMEHTSINHIEKMMVNPTLTHLNIKSANLSNTEGLKMFPNLVSLNLAGNGISKIEGLEHTNQLKKLNISSLWLTQITGLELLTNLKILDLSNQEVSKIEGLRNLTQLEKLNLSENRITRVEKLNVLTQLKYLLLDCNYIQNFDISFLTHLKNSCYISLCHNPIQEIIGDIPKHIKVRFEEENYIPKTLF